MSQSSPHVLLLPGNLPNFVVWIFFKMYLFNGAFNYIFLKVVNFYSHHTSLHCQHSDYGREILYVS